MKPNGPLRVRLVSFYTLKSYIIVKPLQEKNTGSNRQPNHRVSLSLTHTWLFIWYWVVFFKPGPGSKYFSPTQPKG